ncbi:phosphatidylinositol N-acetylglucosaminyltransferase subunit Q-like isoform X2 [Stegodyphus dumicola]|uniref:phosphatidylinositol N-acetylglucosaminyltransferase subunit Q-like isoform X2 n=1 Tax=Stegodyphus dumicola TaxID=202533 RepID=UPI0015AB5437|nr:phosphatidylinositol N-acetylglucosaminyltransferase subunit Q-like isoform X2 [Stegodyphus dumicola]
MSADIHIISVFIPIEIIHSSSVAYLFGHCNVTNKSTMVNCTIALEDEDIYKNATEKLNMMNAIADSYSDNVSFLGVFYSSLKIKKIKTDFLENREGSLQFILRANESYNTFYFEHVCIKSLYTNISCKVILYSSHELMESKLISYSNVRSPNVITEGEDFISFLIKSCKSTMNNVENRLLEKKFSNVTCISVKNKQSVSVISSLVMLTILGAANICKFFSFLCRWWPEKFAKIVLMTDVGRQLHQRFLHGVAIVTDLRSKNPFSLKCSNLLYAILFDIICGWIITYMFLSSDMPMMLLDIVIKRTDNVVTGLHQLINWLMGFPGGLKLNIPLNSALGHFFLYHIYLWETYMVVVQPVFMFVLKISTVIGVLGLTFVLSVFSDIISLATIHIYCFYGYAARLYAYQMVTLSALWRLFRGKKWNPLRQRVDSYTYDVHQLYLGTLIFTVLLFLLPTVMVYYFVFTSEMSSSLLIILKELWC